jgi:hypothetical protein
MHNKLLCMIFFSLFRSATYPFGHASELTNTPWVMGVASLYAHSAEWAWFALHRRKIILIPDSPYFV